MKKIIIASMTLMASGSAAWAATAPTTPAPAAIPAAKAPTTPAAPAQQTTTTPTVSTSSTSNTASTTTSQSTSPATSATAKPAAAPSPTAFCPHISELVKNKEKDIWTAQTPVGGWKSYGVSFANVITKFTGAQWSGENIGQITCVYNSQQVFTVQRQQVVQPTLPVLMVFQTLAFQPKEGKWKLARKGVYNCYSENQNDCPFGINMPKPTGDVYKEAESFKSIPTNTLQPTNH